MKRFIVFISLIFSSLYAIAQDKDIVTEHYKVEGTCEQCEKRIAEAAYIKGVKKAKWDHDTHELTVTYRTSKTSAKEVLAAVARAGHDNEMAKATEKEYSKLPKCCKYRTVK